MRTYRNVPNKDKNPVPPPPSPKKTNQEHPLPRAHTHTRELAEDEHAVALEINQKRKHHVGSGYRKIRYYMNTDGVILRENSIPCQ